MSTAATAGSGTLSYTKKGTQDVAGNLTVSGNAYVDGGLTIGGNLTSTGTLNISGNVASSSNFTNSGTANFTGTFQVNGQVGYVLTEIYEENLSGVTLNAGTHYAVLTTAQFTKPAGEIWVCELDVTHSGYRGYVYEFDVRYLSQTTSYLFYERFHDGAGGGAFTFNRFTGRWVLQSSVTMTDSVTIDASTGNTLYFGSTGTGGGSIMGTGSIPPSKLRIYKYKTA
jgi:hypothetical protein